MAQTSDIQIEERVVISPALSWRAILAGVAVVLVVQLLLAILGGAIGLAFVNPTTTDNPSPGTVGILAAIWWTLSGILAALAGGMTAGRLCGWPASGTAAWHGLVTWAVSTLVVFFFLASATGGIVGGAFSVLGTAAGTAGSAAVAAAPGVVAAADPFSGTEASLNDALGVKDAGAARTAVTSFVREAFTADAGAADAANARASDALARATGITPDEAKQKLADWKAQYDATVTAAKQKAAEAANTARKAASSAGILGVIALLFGALAGWFGGWHSPVATGETRLGPFGRQETRIVG
jgi:hypothetical protein